jgi:phosphoenolpyruvate-protein phosphotransferase
MTDPLQGVPAAPGAAIASVWRYEPLDLASPEAEVMDLDAAVAVSVEQLEALARQLDDQGQADEAEILRAQLEMARDEMLLDEARQRIDAGEATASAILAAGESVAATLAQLDDELLAARAADVRDVAARIARAVRGLEAPSLSERSLAVAYDLPPSVTAELDRSLLAGIVLEAGSRTAHAAILARALGIPAVVGVSGLLAALGDAGTVAIDGDSGEVWLDPDDAQRAGVEARIRTERERIAADRELAGQPLRTSDGHRLMLAANIGQPEEARRALDAGAEGVGLFRTEFMFMGRAGPPDEATQTDAYRQVFRAFGDRPVVVRLLDLGGDKDIPYLGLDPEANPFLGVRALRIARRRPELLVTQLRAILRAGAEAGVEPHVMAPMVADLSDVELYRSLADQARSGLERDGVACPASVQLGIMVEVPSAVALADQLAARVDFFSVGTNDLTQYLLAADRTNPALAAWQDPMHPAVLRALRDVVRAAASATIGVAVCGEMAGDPLAAVVLAGLGIDELSMEASSFGAVKRMLRAVTMADAQRVAAGCLGATSGAEARAIADDALGPQSHLQ